MSAPALGRTIRQRLRQGPRASRHRGGRAAGRCTGALGIRRQLRTVCKLRTLKDEGGGGYLMTKCSGITQADTACKGIPIDGSQWCYVHHPDYAEVRRRHGSKGGKRGGRGRPVAELASLRDENADIRRR